MFVINIKNPEEIMSYIPNSIHRSSLLEEDKKGVFKKTNHVSIEGKNFSKLHVALAMNQISDFWASHNLKPFIHSVSKVSALSLVLSVAVAVGSFSVVSNAAEGDDSSKSPSVTFSQFNYPTSNYEPPYGANTTIKGDVGALYKFIDAADNGSATTWFYLNRSSGSKELVIDVEASLPIPNLSNDIPGWVSEGVNANSQYRYYFAAALKTLAANGTEKDAPYSWGITYGKGDNPSFVTNPDPKDVEYEKIYYLAGDPANPDTFFTEDSNGYSLIVNLKEGASISTKIHGARNDLYGTNSAEKSELIGAANGNSVLVNFGKDSTLFSQIIFGGRSAQRESVKAYTGSETNNNSVVLIGNTLKNKNAFSYKDASKSGNAEIGFF